MMSQNAYAKTRLNPETRKEPRWESSFHLTAPAGKHSVVLLGVECTLTASIALTVGQQESSIS